ncbi:MAG: FG-GAP-like repeat-containing protein [Phycisphaerales bacterium JB052]
MIELLPAPRNLLVPTVCFVLALLPGAEAIGQACDLNDFYPPRAIKFETGRTPEELVSFDFDQDGDLDIATANFSSEDVVVLLNDGTGAFGEGISLGVGGRFLSIDAGLITNDAIPDLVVIDRETDIMNVYRGTGDGHFALQLSYSLRFSPRAVRLGDFDQDGDLDLVVAHTFNTTRITLYWNNGFGHLTEGGSYETDDRIADIRAEDFDLDGDLDLLLLGLSDSTFQFYYNDGAGVFSDTVIGKLDGYIVANSVSDLNGDGYPDLVTSDLDHGRLIPYINDTMGSFIAAPAINVSSEVLEISTPDLDGDGDRDIVSVSRDRADIGVCFNLGGGVFSTPQFHVVGGAGLLNTGDYDDDGIQDLLYTVGNNISLLKGQGRGEFDAPRGYHADLFTISIKGADLNLDGWPDVVVANKKSDAVGIFLNTGDGDGTLSPQISYTADNGTDCVVTSDLNGDGWPDLATANGIGDTVSTLMNRGDGTFEAALHYAVGDEPTYIAAGDLDNDLDIDLVSCNRGSNGFTVLRNDGEGGFSVEPERFGVFDPRALVMHDINGDGLIDLFFADHSLDAVMLFLNQDGDLFNEPMMFPAGNGTTSVALADLDGDGIIDMVSSQEYTRQLALWLGTSDEALFHEPIFIEAAQRPQDVKVGDINNDGHPDLVVADEEDGPAVLVYLNDGNAVFTRTSVHGAGNAPNDLLLTDLNADGGVDIVASNHSSDSVSVLMHRCTRLCAADINADGVLSFFDVSAFLVGFINQDPIADFTNDGDLDFFDVSAFLILYGKGCP